MADIKTALREAAARLAAVSDTPMLDAELLLSHALGIERTALLGDPAGFDVPARYAGLVERRLGREPVAYIIGYRDFWTVRIKLGPGALVPRADSETLIEVAAAHFGRIGPHRILDLGTGPGTLLLAALDQWPASTGLGIDASDRALDYAFVNARALDMSHRASFRRGDWARDIDEKFDLILCNPPYIGKGEEVMLDVAMHEPHEALFADMDGLAAYWQIIPQLPRLLAPGGIVALEVGWTQAEAVSALAESMGLIAKVRRDLGGRDRMLLLRHGDGLGPRE